jgi:hypothetical protein
MFRRTISSAVLMGFLASQLAMFPHAHAAESPDHHARPHVHVGGHAHSHDDPHPTPQSDHEHPPCGFHAEPHDHDAVYLPNSGPAQASSGSSVTQMVVALLNVDPRPVPLANIASARSGTRPCPDALPDDGPLFLDLRTLRI